MRLCHAVMDVTANEEAFILSFYGLSMKEFNRRQSPEVARPDAWAVIATAWNSREYCLFALD